MKIWWDKLVDNGSLKLPRAFALRPRVIRSVERLTRLKRRLFFPLTVVILILMEPSNWEEGADE